MTENRSQPNNLFLCLSSAADEKLVAKLLEKKYTICSNEHDLTKKAIDLVVVDFTELHRLYDTICFAKKEAGSTYLPIMVMVSNERLANEKVWEIADNVVVMPVSKKNLLTRVKGLIKIRHYSCQVQSKQKKLDQKNRQLKLYYNAIHATTSGLVITDSSRKDNPIIFCNDAFTELTGYSRSEILGWNCRFLQGDDRHQPGRTVIQKAIENETSCEVLLRNYRKDGSLFWNELRMSPIKTKDGFVKYYIGIQNDVTELIKTQYELKSTKDKWEGIVSQSPNLIQISVNGVIKFINKVGATLLGFDHPDEAIGTCVLDLHPVTQQKKIKERIEKLNNGEQTLPEVHTITDSRGITRHIKVQSIPISYEGKLAAQTVGVDVTQMKESELELSTLLRQKEVLIQEVHHRVKNNLAIISSLIELQIPNLENEDAISYLRDTQMRVISIANVHEMLYGQDNLHKIELDQYVDRLVDKIKSTVEMKEREIHLGLNIESILLNLDQTIACGLLLNELITNSIKHGFDEGETIRIDISATEDSDTLTITYRDYGKGMPETTDIDSNGNFGSMIIQILVQQLRADYSLNAKGGMEVILHFKRAEYRGPSRYYS